MRLSLIRLIKKLFGRRGKHEFIDLGDIILVKGNPYSGIARKYTAGEDLSAGDVVYVSADNTVKKASSSHRVKVIGVASETKSSGQTVTVIHFGRASVVTDGAVSIGDPVTAAPTAGRVVSITSHSHSIGSPSTDTFVKSVSSSTGSAGSHSHGFTPDGSISSVDISHTHSVGITSGSPSATVSVATDPSLWQTLYAASTSGGSPTTSFKAAQSTNYIAVGSSTHTHYVSGSTGTGGSTSHSHTFTGSSGTTDSAGSHSHSISSTTSPAVTSIPSSTGASDTAAVLGKALTSATGAGQTIDILVCLAG